MTKVEVVASFREMLKDSPTGTLLRGDRIAKPEAFKNQRIGYPNSRASN